MPVHTRHSLLTLGLIISLVDNHSSMLHKTEGHHLLVFVLSSEIVVFPLKHSTQVQSPCKFTVLKFLVRKVISHLLTAAKK